MDVSSVSSAGHSAEPQAKTGSAQKEPPPPPQTDSVEISKDAKALASKSVLDE